MPRGAPTDQGSVDRGPRLRRLTVLVAAGGALVAAALALPTPTASSAGAPVVAGARAVAPSPTIATTVPAPEPPPEPAAVAVAAAVVDRSVAAAPAPACRAAVLVHGGGYFFGDAGALEVTWAEPLRRAGVRVWNVDYPMLPDMPDVVYDPADPWYPRADITSTPAALRLVHDRATDAVAPAVEAALASGCRVTLLGISAGGSIVADLAHRYPAVDEAVLVAGATLTPDRVGGAPLRIFYGTADAVVLPEASVETCDAWVAAGSRCAVEALAGEEHVAPALTDAALRYLLGGG